jgi:hypothetical protein
MPKKNQEKAVNSIVIKCNFLVLEKAQPTRLNNVNRE